MIDPVLLRENPELIKQSQELRGESSGFVDDALAADAARRTAISEFESLRAEQNAFGKQVAKAPKEEKAALVAQAQELAAKVKEANQRAGEAESAFTTAMQRIGNVVIDGVPAGGEDDFIVLREVGEIPAFEFEPRDHLELGELLDAIDMSRGAKVSGARFHFLKGVGVMSGVKPLAMARSRPMFMSASSSRAPTPLRKWKRAPETLAPRDMSMASSSSPSSR